MNVINPLWTAYNNLHNEGGEGYNPHQKYVDTVEEPLWSRLGDKAYRLQNLLNGMSSLDPRYAEKMAELEVIRVAEADAIARNI